MPKVRIYITPGRTVEQKRNAVKHITEVMERTLSNAGPQMTQVYIHELEPENFGYMGKLYLDHVEAGDIFTDPL